MVGSSTISSLKFTPIKPVKKGVPNNHEKKKNALLFCGCVFPLLVTLILIFSSFSS